MASPSTIEGRVIALLRTPLCLETPPATTDRLVADLACDSLDLVEIVMYCEDEFCIEIDGTAADKCETVADLVTLVNACNPS